ncbi:MAG: hypothetical protein M3Q68_06180 [Actinomycetota bacterium]|nr:hypothetical protein [Actinomycetota bacterium]
MNPRELAKYYAGGRIGIGVLFFLFPRRLAKGLWGDVSADSPAVKFLSRIVGVRDVILGAGAIAALQQEADGAKGLARPWMTYGAVADAGDAVATLLAYKHLPRRKRFGLLVMAASGAATGGYLTTTLDD